MKLARPPARLAATLIALVLASAAAASASTQRYALDLPADRTLAYRIEIEVPHPGTIEVEADWSGNRVVSFLLVGPTPVLGNLRRAGPPPQQLKLTVPEDGAGPGQIWTLRIRALPAREAAEGTIEIRRPGAPEPAPARPEPARAEPPPEPEPSFRPAPVPEAAPELGRLFATVEAFRAGVVQGTFARPDRYRWQEPLLQYLALHRDEIAAQGKRPAYSTRLFLERLVGLIRRIEEFRDSRDPLVAGPGPEDSLERRAWLVLRRQHVAPLERDLDSLMSEIQNGHAPELADEPWPVRLLSGVTACERHFEQSGRIGPDRARYGDVAAEQWDPILAAAEALESLALLADEAPAP